MSQRVNLRVTGKRLLGRSLALGTSIGGKVMGGRESSRTWSIPYMRGQKQVPPPDFLAGLFAAQIRASLHLGITTDTDLSMLDNLDLLQTINNGYLFLNH